MNILTSTLWLALSLVSDPAPAVWQQISPGMDIQYITAKNKSNEGDSRITIVRIDPYKWELVFMGIRQTGEESNKTVREWCGSNKLTAAINAGMFATDYRTHIGYLRFRDHVYCGNINNYQSVLAFDPRKGKEIPPFRIFDLDANGVTMQTILRDYSSAVENLRLIKKPRINVWKQQDRRWSEAAIGEDDKGRILFIFSRSPFSMHDLNMVLLEAGIGIVAAQHLEGGPESQLYMKSGSFAVNLSGSYETSYNEDNGNVISLPIPNILGVRPRTQAENH
jgi:hypothetical protein